MFFYPLSVVVSCLFVIVTAEQSCYRWRAHRNFHLIHSDDDCGQEKVGRRFFPKILNGRRAPDGRLPWMVFVGYTYPNFRTGGVVEGHCGGSIINEHYVLTAAHCVEYQQSTFVVIGTNDMEDWSSNTPINDFQTYPVKEHIVHPDFNLASLKNDIALLRIDGRISFKSPNVNYICLPASCDFTGDIYVNKTLLVAGWGETQHKNFATALKKVEVPGKECQPYKKGKVRYFPSPSQMCAGGNDVLACSGDSGGPLVYKAAGRAVQVGVLSFGPKHCSPSLIYDQFDYYSRVTSFMSWILDNIRE